MKSVNVTEVSLPELIAAIEETVVDRLSEARAESSKKSSPMDIEEAAEFCQCKPVSIRKAVSEHRLKHYKPLGKLLFFQEDLINWIKSK